MDFESEVSKKIKKSSRAFEVLFALNVGRPLVVNKTSSIT